MVTKDLGMVTAYAYAVAGGYTGTEAEFTQLMADLAVVVDDFDNFSVNVTTLPAGSSATASYADGVLSLGIPKGDKGDKGNTGETGAPAGFGTVSATVDDSIGTPSVEVTASGSDTAKNFDFAFHNLKGQKGDKGDTGDVSQAQLDAAVSDLKSALYGKAETTSGGKLVDGYYPHDSGQVRSSANFNCYKYDISNADLVVVTLSGFNSTIAVASNSNYDAAAFPSASFSAQTDKLIYPSEAYGSITRWTEIAYVSDYDYLYVACYKNATPSVIGYNSQGALPIALSNQEAISSLNFIAQRQMVFGYGTQLNTASSWEAFSNDADNLTPNRVYVVVYSTDIAHLPYSGFGGFIQTYSYDTASSAIILQIATKWNGKERYQRVCWGGTWSAWQRLSLYDDISAYIESFNHTNDLWKTLHTVGVIGDSLASGESASNDGGSTVYHDLYPFSWGQCMARESGNTYYNFSKGGLTSKTWMTNADYGYALASQPDKLCDAYIIGLGVNDNIVGMTVGTSADINLSDPDANADTFYGNYGKIIQKMRILAPKAPIFVITQPTIINAYTAAIKAMATIFENVFVIDMYKYAIDFSDVNGLLARCQRSGHYNAIGYKIISKYISRELNNVMLDNFDDFMQVEFINTDWTWTE